MDMIMEETHKQLHGQILGAQKELAKATRPKPEKQNQQEVIELINKQLCWIARKTQQANSNLDEVTKTLLFMHRESVLQTRQHLISATMDPKVSLRIRLRRIQNEEAESNPQYEIQKPREATPTTQSQQDQERPTTPPKTLPSTTPPQMGRQTARMRNTLPPKKRPLTVDLTSEKAPPPKQTTPRSSSSDETTPATSPDTESPANITMRDHIDHIIESQLRRADKLKMTREMFDKAWSFLRENIENGIIDTEENTGMPKDILDLVQTPDSMQHFFQSRRKPPTRNDKTCFCGHRTCNKNSHWIKEVPKTHQRCRCGRFNCNILGHKIATELAREEDLPKSRWSFPAPKNQDERRQPNKPTCKEVPLRSSNNTLLHPERASSVGLRMPGPQDMIRDDNKSIRVFGSTERLYPRKGCGKTMWHETNDPRYNQDMDKARRLRNQLQTFEERTGSRQAPYNVGGQKFTEMPSLRQARKVVGIPLGSRPYDAANPPEILPTNVTPAVHRKKDILVPAMYIPENTYWIIRASQSTLRPGKFCTTLWPLEPEHFAHYGQTPTNTLNRK